MIYQNIVNDASKKTHEKNPQKDQSKVLKAANAIKVSLSQKELNLLEKSPQEVLKCIMRQWLPIAATVIEVIIEHLPNPIIGFKNKFNIIKG